MTSFTSFRPVRIAPPVVTLTALLVAACGAPAGPVVEPEARAIVLGPRDVATATRTSMSSGIVLTGSLNPYRQVDVRVQVPGVVTAMQVDRGDPVREGQMMATIEAQGIRSQAASADAQIAGAQSNVALARRQLESAEMLFTRGAVSALDFQTAQSQLEAAEAQLAATRAQATGARESAARTVIEAPIAGQISRRSVSEGEAVQPGQTLFTIVNTSSLELAGQAPVEEAARVKVGQAVVPRIGRTYRSGGGSGDPSGRRLRPPPQHGPQAPRRAVRHWADPDGHRTGGHRGARGRGPDEWRLVLGLDHRR
jgi:multidrug efflux pump subunit AcrA (membrane-fusion protein)